MINEINQELFGKILEQIRTHPEQHEQGDWEVDWGECGTTRCVGGWAIYLGLGLGLQTSIYDTRRDDPFSLARDLLGLTSLEASKLFYGCTNEKALELVERYALKGRE